MFKIIISVILCSLIPTIIAADAPDVSTWVRFTSFTYTGKITVSQGTGQYLNPIIAGFYPDPSICRVGEKTVIVNGGTDISKHPSSCEGPHLYKINSKYYLMCAQGGTSTAHTEVIFKSDSLRGPYVPWEKNPILTQMNLSGNRPNPVTCTVTMTSQPQTANCIAGLAAFQNETNYYAINVKIESGNFTEISLEQPAPRSRDGRGGRNGRGARSSEQAQPNVLASQELPDNTTSIVLRIEGEGPKTRVFYKLGSTEFTQLGEDLQSSYLSTDTAGGFQGVTLGMFAHN